jgi:hypothetical protein
MTAALLRVAGLPISLWLAGASESLFADINSLERRRTDARDEMRRLAERIGEVIPSTELNATGRAILLDVRRQLHGGGELPGELTAEAVRQLRLLPHTPGLAGELATAAEEWQALRAAGNAAELAANEEQDRLRRIVWTLLSQQSSAYAALSQANPQLLGDIEDRVTAGESWHSKRMRQRGDYLWRMIARGATRATPRGLLGQLAVLAIEDTATAGGPIELAPVTALEWSDNLYERAGTTDPVGADDLLGLTPLHWPDGEHVCFLVRRPGDDSRLCRVRMRDTAPLRALRSRLARPCSLQHLLERLVPAGAPEQTQRVVAGFLQHLIDAGVIEVFRPAQRQLSGWQSGQPKAPPPPVPATTGGYLDSYRRPVNSLSRTSAVELADLIQRALHVLHAIADLPATGLPVDIGLQPRPVSELLTELEQAETDLAADRPHPHDWLDAQCAPGESGYGQLVSWLTGQFDTGCRSLDLDQAPPVRSASPPVLSWPIDCLLRPVRSGGNIVAVLDRIEPAGTLDSRFAETLAELDGSAAERLAQYRAFLAEVERHGGGRFVEVLIPSLAARAANAVRRPGYTTLWTGDPHRARYIADRSRSAEYLPLSDITLAVRGGRLEAQADGQLIWPVYHATRATTQPWARLSELLQMASPRPRRAHWRSLGWTLPGWPERSHLPRLTVGAGALVLAPEQWRLPLNRDWPAADTTFAKCRQLARWRAELGLPRWISVTPEVHEDPVPCDLSSVQTVALFDRYQRQGRTDLMTAELLPDPEQLAVRDLGHGPNEWSVSELLFRLPETCDTVLAQRAAAAWQARRRQAIPAPALLAMAGT